MAIGVTLPLLAFRRFAPNEIFPISYRRGRSAHLDVGGRRGEAIRRAVEDQLGVAVLEVEPFGQQFSASSTPLRLKAQGDPGATYLFGKLYAVSHLRADRWYKLGRELLYGRLEDEKPFNTVRRAGVARGLRAAAATGPRVARAEAGRQRRAHPRT